VYELDVDRCCLLPAAAAATAAASSGQRRRCATRWCWLLPMWQRRRCEQGKVECSGSRPAPAAMHTQLAAKRCSCGGRRRSLCWAVCAAMGVQRWARNVKTAHACSCERCSASENWCRIACYTCPDR
jgi:hypothetical protein